MTEASPEPNLIISLNAFDRNSVKMAFTTLAVACETNNGSGYSLDRSHGG
jgi:hypothetical protein